MTCEPDRPCKSRSPSWLLKCSHYLQPLRLRTWGLWPHGGWSLNLFVILSLSLSLSLTPSLLSLTPSPPLSPSFPPSSPSLSPSLSIPLSLLLCGLDKPSSPILVNYLCVLSFLGHQSSRHVSRLLQYFPDPLCAVPDLKSEEPLGPPCS